METEASPPPSPPPFFILGLPRTRTAWLSTVCTLAGAPCTHEGMRDLTTFAEYAANRPARGDADPTLCFWIRDLLEAWPQARFVVIERHDADSLASMLTASPPELREALAQKWHEMAHAFSLARDLLRDSPEALFCSFEDLRENATLVRILTHISAPALPTDAALTRWQRLKITTHLSPDVAAPRPLLPESAAVRASEVCDVSGLHAELYQRADFPLVAQWWRAHTGQQLQEAALPPLGVRVSNGGHPVAALWCYECYGTPVAELVFPVTRPGLNMGEARRAVLYAISCLIQAAGKGHVPEARFSQFKLLSPASLARFVERLGFRPALTDRKPMVLTL